MDERHEAGLLRAVKACLIHNTLLSPPEISISVVAIPCPDALLEVERAAALPTKGQHHTSSRSTPRARPIPIGGTIKAAWSPAGKPPSPIITPTPRRPGTKRARIPIGGNMKASVVASARWPRPDQHADTKAASRCATGRRIPIGGTVEASVVAFWPGGRQSSLRRLARERKPQTLRTQGRPLGNPFEVTMTSHAPWPGNRRFFLRHRRLRTKVRVPARAGRPAAVLPRNRGVSFRPIGVHRPAAIPPRLRVWVPLRCGRRLVAGRLAGFR